jgi:sulfite oxidase
VQQNLRVSRRGVLLGSTGAIAAGVFASPSIAEKAVESPKPLPDSLTWKNADALIVHSANTIETKREVVGSAGITPLDELFVRNNIAPPPASIMDDPDAWQLSVEGVKAPRALSVADLKKLGIETVASVLQCSGNGRAFFKHKASGTPWQVGAAGCVLWTGVPLRAVAAELGGVLEGRKFITGTGGEVIPEGLDPKSLMVERSVPLDALDTALLAWEVNGKPIPLAHGGPLRFVVPGFFGVNNVKYIKKLAFTETESDSKIQKSGYRVRGVGVKGAPDQPSMWQMPVKSWIRDPLATSTPGRVPIRGIAFGGAGGVKKVEVSVDGGKTWSEASLVGPDLGPYAWRTFAYTADLKAGSHEIACRATDTAGETQPEIMEENERGYRHNGWRSHAVTVTVG